MLFDHALLILFEKELNERLGGGGANNAHIRRSY